MCVCARLCVVACGGGGGGGVCERTSGKAWRWLVASTRPLQAASGCVLARWLVRQVLPFHSQDRRVLAPCLSYGRREIDIWVSKVPDSWLPYLRKFLAAP